MLQSITKWQSPQLQKAGNHNTKGVIVASKTFATGESKADTCRGLNLLLVEFAFKTTEGLFIAFYECSSLRQLSRIKNRVGLKDWQIPLHHSQSEPRWQARPATHIF